MSDRCGKPEVQGRVYPATDGLWGVDYKGSLDKSRSLFSEFFPSRARALRTLAVLLLEEAVEAERSETDGVSNVPQM